MECVITIELGTNAVRVVAFDLNGNVIGSMKGAYPTFHIEPDYSEQDPEQIFITMLYVLKNLLCEEIHPKNYNVISICFSASMHSVLAIDKTWCAAWKRYHVGRQPGKKGIAGIERFFSW